MNTVRRFTNWFKNQKRGSKFLIVLVVFFVVCCLCSVPVAVFSPKSTSTPLAQATGAAAAQVEVVATSEPTTQKPTDTPASTNTPKSTSTPKPTNTPEPPTATPDPNRLSEGVYMVQKEAMSGIYKGQSAGNDILQSCYWARLKDVSGELDSIIANDNAKGPFYFEVLESDGAIKVACDITRLERLPDPPAEFPQKISPGMYLVGIDIQPGTYKGTAGTDILESCYWARLKNVEGSMDSIIANDNSTGPYYMKVNKGDFAIKTACDLERISD